MLQNGLIKDLVIVLPGITGSTLARFDGSGSTPLWDLSVGAAQELLLRREESIDQLLVPIHDPRIETPETLIRPVGLMPGFHGIYGLGRIAGYSDLTTTLCRKLELTVGNAYDDIPANLIEFPYDWRLSCRYNARELRAVIDRKLGLWREYSGEPGAKVVLIAHSMGGLVARYYLEVTGDDGDRGDGQWRKCRALFSFGTPYRGSVDAVGYVANGYKKFFLDFTRMVRSCPSIYELMPIYSAISHNGTWSRPNEVSIPNAVNDYVAAGKDFHDEIKAAAAAHGSDPTYRRHGYKIFPFVGVGQTTLQSAMLSGNSITTSWIEPDSFDSVLAGGDGTVPRVSATPVELSDDRRETFLGEQHGFLHSNAQVKDDLVERLKQLQSLGLGAIQGGGQQQENFIDLLVDDIFGHEEPVKIRARASRDNKSPYNLKAVLQQMNSETPLERHEYTLTKQGEFQEATIEGLPTGQYKLTVQVDGGIMPSPNPVHGSFDVVSTAERNGT